ncbi:MAG: efflux transporter outer membrane subunit [Tannerellaceae bacterium]|nr:efflux transporter outer membrane subunit [Tannerellaceae bacterium]
MKKIIIFTAATFLTGCGLYKPCHRPDIETEGLFGDTYEIADTTTSIGDVRWQDIFTDPHLQHLINQGLENNTDMQSAYLRVKQAEAGLMASRLAFLPSLHLAPEGSLSSFDRSAASKAYTLPVAASWEIDVFGRLQNAKKRSKAAYLQSQEYTQAVRTQLIAAIANYYYLLLMLDSQYEITLQTAATWQESVETMRAMKEAGMTTEAGVAQIEGTWYAIEASLHDLAQQINETQNSLALILAEPPHQIARGSLKEQDFTIELTTGVPLQLLANRPDVKSAELSLMQAHYATNEARSYLYPSIMLSGVAGWTNSVGSYIVNPGKLLLSAAASLTQPLFNKGIHLAQVKIAEAQRQEAMLNFRQVLLNAGAEVNDALVQYQTARNKRELRTLQIEAMERAVESTELLMAHTSTTYLEILTAQQSLLSAQLTQAADQFSEIQGIISLYHALGGGRELYTEEEQL